MRTRFSLLLVLGFLAAAPILAGTLTVEVHAAWVDDGSSNGYIGSLGQYYWDRAIWEHDTSFSFGVTHVIVGASYWSGTVNSDAWSNYLRSGFVEQGTCWVADLAVQVFKADSPDPVDGGNAERRAYLRTVDSW